MPDALLTVAEAAAALRMSRRWVQVQARRGRIRGVRLGRRVRIPLSEVKRLAREGLRNAP
ncbi:MAG: helix-turn-helix domain-containing protein [Actinomycetia bacterium]|nr:helix-turn-helix domain-containing protein [Actinomycetes bacterium]